MGFKNVFMPLGMAYQGSTGLRNWLYDRSWVKAQTVEAKIVSIGNLTVGGTGKTPVTLAVLDQLHTQGVKCGVVSRGYRRETTGVHEVELTERASHRFGDEPTLIKTRYPDVPVFVGEKRAQAARELLSKQNVSVIIADDAFQHRRLHRDLDLLLVDTTEVLSNYRPLPVGRARESVNQAFRRADFVILTKYNQASAEQIQQVEAWLALKGLDKPILKANYQFKGFTSVGGESRQKLDDGAYLVSGIAKPQAFERTVEGHVRVLKHKTFPDHHTYTDLEIEQILDEAASLQARWILTTAKDSMKLGAFPRLKHKLWIVELGLEFTGDTKAFHEALGQLARSSR